MSEVIDALRESTDPLDNDLAEVYDLWQETRRGKGLRASLGYEPRDIKSRGAVTVISRRVLNASAGFEEVNSDQSYEALVLKYSERFTPDVIAAARLRLKLGTSEVDQFRRQDIQFFIKSSAIELFGETGVQCSTAGWANQSVNIPKLHKESNYAEEALTKGFRSLIWLHEQENDGERGRGLTAVVEFGPMQPDRITQVRDAVFFEHPVGKELLEAHKGDGAFISKINASRHSRVWPIGDGDVQTFLTAVRVKAQKIAEIERKNPDPHDPLNLEKIEETTALRRVIQRRHQRAFRMALLDKRPNHCAFTGTSQRSVLDAAHIIPYAERFADRDKLENGLLLRSDIHKLFDAHLISINPKTKCVEVSDRIECPDYLDLRGKIVNDEVSLKSLNFHFENYRKMQPS